MHRVVRITAGWALGMVLAFALSTEHVAAAESPGLDVGRPFPNLILKDQNGKSGRVSEFRGRRVAAIVFHRSADWWPFCKTQLVELQTNLKALEEAGIKPIAVSYDSVETLKRFAQARKITYPLLSDDGSRLIDAAGVRDKAADENPRLKGMPHPGTFLVDADGVIIAKLFHEGYRKRHTSADIIAAAKAREEDSN